MDFDELVIDYLSGNLRGEKARMFLDMIDSDAECARRFDELNRLHALSLSPYFEAGRERNWKLLRRRMGRTSVKRISVPGWFWLAAALVIGVVSGIGVSMWRDGDAQEQMLCEVVVPEGSRTSLTLPDSSTVWLNSGSRMTYSKSFGRKDRSVNLVGEGYFEVRHDGKRPFVVNTDALAVKVLGTIFNVSAYRGNDEVMVDLLKGRVEVAAENGNALTLTPGQQAVLERSSGRLTSGQSAPFVSDWVSGRMSFSNVPVTEILERLQKHFNVRIKVQDSRLAEEYFSGSIDLGLTLDEILKYLDVDEKYSVTMRDGVIYISDRKR